MPSLSELTDYDAMGNATGVQPEADGIRRVYITGQNGDSPEAAKPASYGLVDSIANKLLGLNGQERYQLWPEKVVRGGLSAAGDALAGKTPQWQVDPVTGDVHTSPQMIEGAQAMSALAGSGGLAGTTDATLGATPFLRPALKYKDKLYKGKEGQAHQDVIPDALYPEFQKMAMSGDDISHYNFGFVNDKGQFLTREKALEYGVNTGLIDPSAGKYGALTSTLLADSSKPGMAIEATAKANAVKMNDTLLNVASKDTNNASNFIKNDILIDKDGVIPGKLTNINRSLNNGSYTEADIAKDFAGVRQHLKDTYGDTITLYRADAPKSEHNPNTRVVYMGDENLAKQFASKDREVKPFTIPTDDVLGLNVQPSGYYEFIVRNPTNKKVENAPQFYSALEHNVNQISQGKMTGDQWLGTLANKPGVKPEELQWSGLNEFLNSNKGKPVSKEQIKSFLDENKTELGEVVRGYNPQTTAAGKAMAESQGHKWDELSQVDQRRYIQTANGGKLTEDIGGPKYSQYQVPGGENYREVLMTLPDKQRIAAEARSNEITTRRDQIHDEFNAATPEKRKILEDEFDKLGKELRELDLAKYSIARDTTTYKSSHWDEPNILAHMRMNDRTIDGKKSLHLEEVQSDWHQDGRKKGYKQEYKPDDVYIKETAPTKVGNDPYWDIYKKSDDSHLLRIDERGIDTQADALKKGLSYLAKKDGVPDAPFKKNWHELALKRAIREAAENGYDRLSWTAGEHHPTNPKNLKQSGPDAEAADKGMQGFYNGMLPKSVEKLTGQKVKEGNLENIRRDVAAAKLISEKEGIPIDDVKWQNKTEAEKLALIKKYKMGEKIYYIDLPQSVKDTALGKGFPLFSSSHMFTPIVGNPFESNDK